MAESYAHKWGQLIGNLFQESFREELQAAADRHGLYLDFQRERAARPGRKVTWQDRYGNLHDLDYVLERGGNETTRGLPAAFIETAWHRYTKHSRNKAQEIQGAVLALAETYSHLHPFLGIVLAGVFTSGSLQQLRSCGFSVAYIPYDAIVLAFAAASVDAAFDEHTHEKEFRRKLRAFKALPAKQVERIKRGLLTLGPNDGTDDESGGLPIGAFLTSLNASLSRRVQGISVIVLHGAPQQLASVQDAIAYVHSYDDGRASAALALKYEIDVRYSNGDVVHGIFQEKGEAIRFLQTFG